MIDKQSYDRLMEFAKNHRPNSGFSNMYLFQTKTADGKVTGEYYGMNIFTDVGMNRYFIDKADFPTNLYIGQGTASFDKTTGNVMSEKIPGVTMAATSVSTTKDYKYPLYYYDPTLDGDFDNPGIITSIMKFIECKYPTSITGVTNDFVITEFGIGETIDTLWTHSWIYDINGDRITVTKHLNEELSITVFMAYSYYENLITDGYKDIVIDDGVMKKDPTKPVEEVGTPTPSFSVITTMEKFFNRMVEKNLGTYKRGATYKAYDGTHTTSLFTDSKITISSNLPEIILRQGTTSDAGYIDGFYQFSQGCLTMNPQQREDGESIELTDILPVFNSKKINDANYETIYNINGFFNRFGVTNYEQFTQLTVSNAYLWNYKDKTNSDKYNLDCNFYNDPNYWYNNDTAMNTPFAMPIYYTNNDSIITGYVYQNLRTDQAVKSISGSVASVYATDKYWDKTKWIWISDFSNIPVEAQHCRYWITSSNTTALTLNRDDKPFHLVRQNGIDDSYNKIGFPITYGGYQTASDPDYNWFAISNRIYYFDANTLYTFNVGNVSNGEQFVTHFSYGGKIFTFSRAVTCYITDMTNAASGVHPTTSMTFPFTTQSYWIQQYCYCTESETGIICIDGNTLNQSFIVDLRPSVPTVTQLAAKIACCIWGTNLVAYVDSTDLTRVKIYDADQGITLPDTFPITDGETDMNFIVGHTNYVWLTNGSSYTYLIDLSRKTIKKITTSNYFNIGKGGLKITCVDDVMLIYHVESNISNGRYVLLDDVENIYTTSTLPSDRAFQGTSAKLQYLYSGTDKGCLALLYSSYYLYSASYYPGFSGGCIDFGRYINTGEVKGYRLSEDHCEAVFVPYGDRVICQCDTILPMVALLPTKIEGITHTISTVNHPLRITGKQWQVEFTNTPVFGTNSSNGQPPGVSN